MRSTTLALSLALGSLTFLQTTSGQAAPALAAPAQAAKPIVIPQTIPELKEFMAKNEFELFNGTQQQVITKKIRFKKDGSFMDKELNIAGTIFVKWDVFKDNKGQLHLALFAKDEDQSKGRKVVPKGGYFSYWWNEQERGFVNNKGDKAAIIRFKD